LPKLNPKVPPLLLGSAPLVSTTTHLVAPISVCPNWLRWTHMLWIQNPSTYA